MLNFSARNIRLIVIVVYSVALQFIIIGCWGGSFPALDAHDRLKLERVYKLQQPILQDSPKIYATLNDTIFKLSNTPNYYNIMEYLEAYKSDSAKAKRPMISFMIENISNDSMVLPVMNMYAACARTIGECNRHTIFLDMGNIKDDTCINRRVIHVSPDRVMFLARGLDTLGPGQAFEPLQHKEIDIFGIYSYYIKNCGIDTGYYWVRVGFNNWLWREYSPPIWTGEIISDTLWFHMVDK